MPPAISLRTRLICIFTAMTVVVLVYSSCIVWGTYQVNATFGQVVKNDLILYRISQELELALANQKGFLTYFFVDGNSKWLESIDKYREIFKSNLEEAFELEMSVQQREMLKQIAAKYESYREAKDAAIDKYRQDPSPASISLPHEKQRDEFFTLLELCRTFSEIEWQEMLLAEKSGASRSGRLQIISYWSIGVFLLLSFLFLFTLFTQILRPIRDLAIETGGSPEDSYMDEVGSLSQSLKGMMRDVDETHSALVKSRRNLLQAERMAVVGELAAGVAHTIRNPFTSIKMRMFSLSRSLDLRAAENEDLQVISDEIERIDRIVTNFLEFARPPKLKIEKHDLRELIRSVGTLLEYRLKQYKARLDFDFSPDMPHVRLDSDRIREALVNLITNSCEAMEDGGTIHISESRENGPNGREFVMINIQDTGPGIPEPLRHRVTAPFFTTKEEGSGLGLSIVNRIVREHGGELVIPITDNGCEIIMKFPA